MALNPRAAFQAPQIVGPQGLASQGPAAAARATGGVPPIAMGQGVNMPAPQVPAGLAALQSQNQAAQGTENLIVNMQNEVGNAADSSELNPMLLGAGAAMRQGDDRLSGGGGDESLVGGSPGEDMLDDGSYSEASSASSALPVIPDNITNEQARTIARETMGLTGEEDNEDAYTALMMFGLGLMATPGDLGQAIGKAGLNAMPQIIAARKSQRGRRKDVGVMAYQIQEKDKALRVAASAAKLKQFNEDRGLALDLYKSQQAGLKDQLGVILKDARPGVGAKVLKHAMNPSFEKIFGSVQALGKTPEGMSQLMTRNGGTLAQLAVSSAIRSGDIKEGDLAKYEDPGWTRYTQKDPKRPGWSRSMIYASNRAYARHPTLGTVGIIEPGTEIPLDEWAPPKPTAPVALWGWNPKTGEMYQTTQDGINKKEKESFLEREANTFNVISLAEEASNLATEGGLFATSEAFSFGPKVASYLDAAIKTLAPDNPALQQKIRAQTNKFTGALDKYLGKDLAASKSKKYSDRGIVLNGQNISGKSGVASWLKKIESEDIRTGIADESGDFTEAHRLAFNNLASMQPRLRSMMFNMAYAVARAAEPGGRLTDRDIVNAMLQLGGDKSGNITSPEIFKDVLQQTVRQTAERHQMHARQHPETTGFKDYNIQSSWNSIQRTLTGEAKPLPAWVLQGGAGAQPAGAQPAGAQPAGAQPAGAQRAQTDRLRNSIVTAPITIGDQTTSLAQAHPFFAQDAVDSSGRLRTEKEVFAAMGIPWGKAAGAEGLQEIKNRIAKQEGLATDHPDVRAKAIRIATSFGKFLKNPDAAAQLQSYLQPPYAPSQ
jgi:hypothetical protein